MLRKLVSGSAMVVIVLVAVSAQAETLVNESGGFGPEPESSTVEFSFDVPDADTQLALAVGAELNQGTATLALYNAVGESVFEVTFGELTLIKSLGPFNEPGAFRGELVSDNAVGEWSVNIATIPPRAVFRTLLLSGPLMVAVALAFAIGWKVRARAQWRWFWVGAAIWAVGVGLKFAWAIPLNKPIVNAIKSVLPESAYLAVASVYVGALTGVFEIGVTLIAARIWRSMAREPNRAVAVGVGAGSIEALLLGLVGFASILISLLEYPGAGTVRAAAAFSVGGTPLVFLAGPLERIIAILCHTSSRALVLIGVAQRRWAPFWYGFLIMTGIDAIAGWTHLSGFLGTQSVWWVEVAIAPFAVVSIPIIVWCLRRWPVDKKEATGCSSEFTEANAE